jgi:hypothetical protein
MPVTNSTRKSRRAPQEVQKDFLNFSNFGFLKALISGEPKCFPKYMKRGGHDCMKSATEFWRATAACGWRTPLRFDALPIAVCMVLADSVFAQSCGKSP